MPERRVASKSGARHGGGEGQRTHHVSRQFDSVLRQDPILTTGFEAFSLDRPIPMIPRFDPTRAVVFDLAQGQLRDDEGTGRLNVPADALLRLCAAASSEARRDFGRGLGTDVGRRVRRRLGDAAEAATPEAWVEHLGGELALLGLGNLHLERWGKALVVALAGAPRGADELLAAVIEGALQRALGRDVVAVPLASGEDRLRLALLNERAAGNTRRWLSEGASWSQVLERLHGGRGNA